MPSGHRVLARPTPAPLTGLDPAPLEHFAAPDAPRLPPSQRTLEAGLTHRTLSAELLGRLHSIGVLGEPQVGLVLTGPRPAIWPHRAEELGQRRTGLDADRGTSVRTALCARGRSPRPDVGCTRERPSSRGCPSGHGGRPQRAWILPLCLVLRRRHILRSADPHRLKYTASRCPPTPTPPPTTGRQVRGAL